MAPRSATPTLRSLVVLLALASGCDEVRSRLGLGDAPAASTPTSPTDAKQTLTTTELAYAAGRKYGLACVLAMGEDAKAVELAYSEVTVAAARLGITPPERPSKDDAMDKLFGEGAFAELKEKHDRRVGFAFVLGMKLMEVRFGVGIGAEVAEPIDAIATLAARVPVPDAVWKAPVEALKAQPTKERMSAVLAALDPYFRYDETPQGPAWSSTDAPAPARSPFATPSVAGGYTAAFPYQPSETIEQHDGVEWHAYATSIDIFSVSYADYADAAKATEALERYASNARANDTKDEKVVFAGRDAHSLTSKVGETTLTVRAFVVDRRFYKVGAASKADAAEAQKFLDSFTLTAS